MGAVGLADAGLAVGDNYAAEGTLALIGYHVLIDAGETALLVLAGLAARDDLRTGETLVVDEEVVRLTVDAVLTVAAIHTVRNIPTALHTSGAIKIVPPGLAGQTVHLIGTGHAPHQHG